MTISLESADAQQARMMRRCQYLRGAGVSPTYDLYASDASASMKEWPTDARRLLLRNEISALFSIEQGQVLYRDAC